MNVFALPHDLLVSVLQRLTPTVDEVAAFRQTGSLWRKPTSLTALTPAQHELTEKEVSRIRSQLVLACAFVCHNFHDAVKAWIQIPVNQSELEAFTLSRIRVWQRRTDDIIPGVFAGKKRKGPPEYLVPGGVISYHDTDEETRGMQGVQDFAEGLFSTLRERGRLYEQHLPAACALGGVPARLHLRWPAALAFIHILEEDALQLLGAVMRFRVARMRDEEEEEDPSVESRDLSFCIKERTRQQGGAVEHTNSKTPIVQQYKVGKLPWWVHMPIWSTIAEPDRWSVESFHREVIEQLAAAGPALEVHLAIVQRLAARASIRRFSGDAAKLIWQYVMLQAAALLVRATTPVRELVFPQRVHEKRVDDGLSEASEEEEEMGLSDYENDGVDDGGGGDDDGDNGDGGDDDDGGGGDNGDAYEIEALIRNSEIEAQEDTEGSDSEHSEQEGEVEWGNECDARWDEEEGEWVFLPSTTCFDGAAGWLREGNLRGRVPLYSGRTPTWERKQQQRRVEARA